MLPTNNGASNLYSWMYVSGNGTTPVPEAVSELNHNHILTPEQEEKVAVMVTAYSCATNTSEREDLYPPIKDLVDALMTKRAEVFEVQNEGTDNVKGALREGKTTDDRDRYVRDRLFLYTLKTGMDDVRAEKGLAPCKVDDLLNPHHTTEFAGDLKALKCLVEGRSDDYAPGEPVQVPDLTYNKGSMQFG